MNFIAIDFETANKKRNNPCSIGIVVVKEGIVVDKIHYFIRPREMKFLPINIGIHGIRETTVESEPEFDVIWNKIKGYFEDSFIIAHNASFDISVLRNTLNLYNLEIPNFKYICTMKLAGNFYRGLENVKLSTVNNFLGFKFNHHDALADAEACSNILFNIAKELKSSDINEISNILGVSIGEVSELGYKASRSRRKAAITSRREAIGTKNTLFKGLKKEAFTGEVVVFTGKFSSMTRGEAMSLIKKLGGKTGSAITRKTTYLIANSKELDNLILGEMSTKLRKAVFLKEKGQKIEILNEKEFFLKIKK